MPQAPHPADLLGLEKRNCSDCLYWESYPLASDLGVCRSPSSRYYDRGVLATNSGCDYFVQSDSKSRRCEDCHHWYPLDTMPHLGECHSASSPRSGKAVFWDNKSGECFEERSLRGQEFLWCARCRQTIHSSELDQHRAHRLFVGSSQLSVDEMVEVTLAGD